MPSAIIVATATLALVASLAAAAKANSSLLRRRSHGHNGISLDDFQRVLRTSLDEELDLIAAKATASDGSCRYCQQHEQQIKQESSRPNTASVRRRQAMPTTKINSNSNLHHDSYSQEHVWSHLLQHAWSVAESITRRQTDGPLTILPASTIDRSPRYQHMTCPFLLCSSSSERDVSSLLEELEGGDDDDSPLLWIPTHSLHGNCVMLSTTSTWAQQAMKSNQEIVAQPLVDVMKIVPGTIDSVTSPAWRIPFAGDEGSGDDVPSSHQDTSTSSKNSNSTKMAAIQDWERKLTIDLVPMMDIHEEADLLESVESIMQDIQEMGEVGWLMRQTNGDEHDDEDDQGTNNTTGMMMKPWQEQYLINHSLVGVPSLSDMFSLTSTKNKNKSQNARTENDRIAFWDTSLANGLESAHACASLFSTLMININPHHYHHPSSSYSYTWRSSFTLILNPNDGPPPIEYESSASNVNCVSSLIAGLSVHPSVVGVKNNVPVYHGWGVAHTMEYLS